MSMAWQPLDEKEAQLSNANKEKGITMLSWSLTFLVIALIAGIGFVECRNCAAIAKILFVIFLVLFLVSLISGAAGFEPVGSITKTSINAPRRKGAHYEQGIGLAFVPWDSH